jgi:hypothetical protein
MSGSAERTPYSADSQRRPSIADYSPQYPAPPSSSGGHLQFLGGNSNSQYPAQPQAFTQPSSIPASPVHPPHGQGVPYSSQSSFLPPPPPPQPQPAYNTERAPSQAYTPIVPTRRESGHEHRSSAGSLTLPPINFNQQPPPIQSPSKLAILAPLNVPATGPARLPMITPSPTVAHPPLNLHQAPPTPTNNRPTPQQYAGTKRAHDETFKTDATPRLQNGARDSSEAEDPDGLMVFKRADGRVQCAPPLIET